MKKRPINLKKLQFCKRGCRQFMERWRIIINIVTKGKLHKPSKITKKDIDSEKYFGEDRQKYLLKNEDQHNKLNRPKKKLISLSMTKE